MIIGLFYYFYYCYVSGYSDIIFALWSQELYV